MRRAAYPFISAWILAVVVLGCTAPTSHAPPAPPGLESKEMFEGPATLREGGSGGGQVTYVGSQPGTPPGGGGSTQFIVQQSGTAGGTTGASSSEAGFRDPKVSASRGQEGGIVVLWPRIIPSSEIEGLRPQATALQQALRQMATHTLPGKAQEARPEPERVCPKAGCLGLSFGVLLATTGKGGCVAVAMIGQPLQGPVRLVPWVGDVKLKQEVIGFRDFAESYVTIEDYESCAKLPEKLAANQPRIEEALRQAAGTP